MSRSTINRLPPPRCVVSLSLSLSSPLLCSTHRATRTCTHPCYWYLFGTTATSQPLFNCICAQNDCCAEACCVQVGFGSLPVTQRRIQAESKDGMVAERSDGYFFENYAASCQVILYFYFLLCCVIIFHCLCSLSFAHIIALLIGHLFDKLSTWNGFASAVATWQLICLLWYVPQLPCEAHIRAPECPCIFLRSPVFASSSPPYCQMVEHACCFVQLHVGIDPPRCTPAPCCICWVLLFTGSISSLSFLSFKRSIIPHASSEMSGHSAGGPHVHTGAICLWTTKWILVIRRVTAACVPINL